MNGPQNIPANEDQRQLIVKATDGDRFALEKLLLIHYNSLARYIAAKLPASVRPLVTAEDILQQTFMHAFRDIRNFEARSDACFFAWLKTISENRLIDTVKALNRKKRGGEHHRIQKSPDARTSSLIDLVEMLSTDGRSPSRSAAGHEAVRAVHVALASLGEDQREAIQLRFIEGKSIAEIAERMNRTSDAVRGLLHRAKQQLRGAMGRSSRWLTKR